MESNYTWIKHLHTSTYNISNNYINVYVMYSHVYIYLSTYNMRSYVLFIVLPCINGCLYVYLSRRIA